MTATDCEAWEYRHMTDNDLVHRLDIDAALDRAVDHVRNMDYDELAMFLSDRCLDGVVVVEGDDEESAPYRDGRRMRVRYEPDVGQL